MRVEVDDTLLADAAAGSDYVKIRSGATFSQRDIDILEVHEGWVHVATSLNGQAQPVARWLAKGPPRTTAVQEGLAALVRDLHVPHAPAARQEAQRSRPRGRQGRGRRELPRRLRVVPHRGLRRGRVLPEHAPRLPRRRSSRAARRSPRTPATARASSSTTRSCARAIQHDRARAHPVPLRRQGRARGRPGARTRT